MRLRDAKPFPYQMTLGAIQNDCKSCIFAKHAEIAGSYVEFAERLPLPQYAKLPKEKLTNSHRREGFETGNADKIFESTFSDQINKKS